MSSIEIATPRWGLPFLKPKRYKGLKGGRSSGKSHFFAELMVEECVLDPYLSCLCAREIQKSLKFSAKRLIESKIQALGVGNLFDILETEIRRKGRTGSTGIIIFQGMQDHTAESIKSLEGFNRAWVEEAQRISARSIELLDPTMRAEKSELWFSWNPDQPTDPVEQLFNSMQPDDYTLAHINYSENPFCPDEVKTMADKWRVRDPDTFGHVWLGEYNTKSDAQILNGRWEVAEFDPQADWHGPYFGADWGFSQDPTTLVKCWVHANKLYIEHEFYKVGLEITDTPAAFKKMPGADRHVIRADSARPETISHMRRSGLNVVAANKGKGSVEDGIAHLRGYDRIIIHPRCTNVQDEARLYSYKRDRLTGDVLTDIIDANNHCIDAIRYALEPLSRRNLGSITIL